MQKILALTFLGASLAFSASAALASESVDYKPAFQPTENVAIVNRTESDQSVTAGVAAPVSVWSEAREANREH